jgi:radical SAM superfamily enzyme YgiQ (UPF0313 family)
MRVYLLNPPFIPRFVRCGRWQGGVARGATLYYPIWLSYATGVLENEFGKRVRLVDAPAWKWDREDVINDVSHFKPDLIVVDTNFSSLQNDIEVASDLKRVKEEASTIMVGPPTSQFSEKILKNPHIDAVARFEYDFTVRDFAKALQDDAGIECIPGLSYREDSKIVHNVKRPYLGTEDLDTIPFVSRVYHEHLNVLDYFLSHTLNPMVQIFTSRGCPNQCIFCGWPVTLTGRQHRVRSVENVADEFDFIANTMPEVREIFLEDDTFTMNKARIRDFCEEINDRDLRMTWSCNARATLDYESMRIMKKAGCRLLDVGFESGSDEILRNIKKRITTNESRRFARDARKARLMVLADVIIGMPGETKETAEQTIRFVKEIKPNIVQFAVATPLPGTEFYKWVKEHGFLLVDDLTESLTRNGFQKCIVSYPGLSSEDIEHFVDRGLKEYYLTPSYIPTALRNVIRKNGSNELIGMLKSARLFLDYLHKPDEPGEEEHATH